MNSFGTFANHIDCVVELIDVVRPTLSVIPPPPSSHCSFSSLILSMYFSLLCVSMYCMAFVESLQRWYHSIQWCINRFCDSIFAARGRLSHSAVGDKSQVQDTGSGSGDAAPIVTENRIKPRSRQVNFSFYITVFIRLICIFHHLIHTICKMCITLHLRMI